MRSYISLFRNYANFRGFMKRGAYWTAMLIHILILLLPWIPVVFLLFDKSLLPFAALDLRNPDGTLTKIFEPWVLPIWCFYFLLTRIPILSAAVRRLRSLPRSGWWILIGLIPVVGWFILFIWLLQKGSYDDFERRMKREGLLRSEVFEKANRPRQGGWFFVVFALLAVGGFFLNRQIQTSGSVTAAFSDIQAALPKSWNELKFWEHIERKTTSSSILPTAVTEPVQTGSTEAMGQENTEVVLLRPVEGVPILPRKINQEGESPADDYLNIKYGYGLFPAGEGVLASRRAVSVSAYRMCVDEGVCEMPVELNTLAYRKMITEAGQVTDSEHDAGSLPMVYVTRDQAAVFCEWAGMRLPTADEWREAAKTGTVSEWTSENANCVGTDRSQYYKTDDQLALTVSVNAFDEYASDYGMIQMAGNVWEWVTSEDEAESTALALGGAWNSYPSNIGRDASLQTLVGYSADNIGFRCFVDEAALTSDMFWGGEPISAETIDAEELDTAEVDAVSPEPVETDTEPDMAAAESDITDAEPDTEEKSGIGNAAVSIDAVSKKADKTAEHAAPTAASQTLEPAEEIIDAEVTEPTAESEGESDPSVLIRPQDNGKMVLIPASTFNMGTANGAVDEKPVHEVTLSAYWIDAYEVTNKQYALCVAEGVCTEPHMLKSFRSASYYTNPDYENYPVIAVDHMQAETYCQWVGTRLPTEAEWEFAAKGPEGNTYPWGDTFISANLNYSGNGNFDTVPVDGSPEDVSAFGVYSLAGNVSEWVSDRYQEDWYTVTDQAVDPTGPLSGNYYVIRGGSAQTGENTARTADRFYALNTSYSLDRGFRCAFTD